MKKLLLLLICPLLINCGQSYPEKQQLFLDKINLISDKYMEVYDSNELAKDITIKDMKSYLKKFENVTINNWMGNIESIGVSVMDVETEDGTYFQLFAEDGLVLADLIDRNVLLNLKEGQLVSFSGLLLKEQSLTTGGMMRDPEFKVILQKLTIP